MAEVPGPVAVILHPHWGHQELLAALARARLRGSLPPALLVHGPRGVGKQHLGLWLGRLLLCADPSEDGPCGTCESCHLASLVEHPDLHWYFPLPRPKGASTPEKLAQALEEARADVLQEIRNKPLRPTAGGEPRSLYLAAARSLRRRAQSRPSLGDKQVFLVADAEALAPQEASSEAANALLKLLEEPPPGTFLILTSSEPGRLLPTIRSRTTQIHLSPLSPSDVGEFLVEVGGVDPAEAQKASALSQGSIGRALGFLPDGGDPGPLTQLRAEALRLVAAVLASGPGAILEEAAGFPSVGGRGLMELLNFLEEAIRDLAVDATASTPGGGTGAPPGRIEKEWARRRIEPASVAAAFGLVDEARAMAAGNVNPQLVIFGLLHDLRGRLIDSPQPETRRS